MCPRATCTSSGTSPRTSRSRPSSRASASTRARRRTSVGSASSRDWAAKGTLLLGVRAVLAESYERIHRSNLVGMGVLPLQFKPGEGAETFGITGTEALTIVGISGDWTPRQDVSVDMVRA